MSDELLGDRRRALEDEFFRREDAALVERLRSEKERAAAREELSGASGISDTKILDALLDVEVSASGLTAFALVPLVEVAWADGKLDGNERASILDAAEKQGVLAGSDARELLEHWLDSPTAPSLLRAWIEYTKELCTEFGQKRKDALCKEVIGRARAVAESAGGLLGIGAISSDEQEVLRLLEAAFADTDE